MLEPASAVPVIIVDCSLALITLSAVISDIVGAVGASVSVNNDAVAVSLIRPLLIFEVTDTDSVPWPALAKSVALNTTEYVPSALEVTFFVMLPIVTATVALLSAVPVTVRLASGPPTSLSVNDNVGTGIGSSLLDAANAIPPPANAPIHNQFIAKKPFSVSSIAISSFSISLSVCSVVTTMSDWIPS